jgi:hypothetical protein
MPSSENLERKMILATFIYSSIVGLFSYYALLLYVDLEVKGVLCSSLIFILMAKVSN